MGNVRLTTEEDKDARIAPLTIPPVTATTEEGAVGQITSARRYDQATIERALALAIEMQQEHQATLTAEQVVRLGEEINVDQAFVLKALAQVSPDHQGSAAVLAQARLSPALSHQQTPVTMRTLSRLDKVAAVILPLIYTAFALLVFRHPLYGLMPSSEQGVVSLAVLFVIGPILALLTGAGLRSKRLGALSGSLLGFWMVMAAWTVSLAAPNNGDLFGRIGITFAFTAAGALLGTSAAMVAMHGGQIYRRSATALTRYFPGLAGTDA